MSTRANIILTESYSYRARNGRKVAKTEKLYLYRHSDGYPEGVMPTLGKFIDWLKRGKIARSIQQGAGWLIMLGACEYNTIPRYEIREGYGDPDTIADPLNWKVGAYEITNGIHGDIEFLYTVDLTSCALTVQRVRYDERDKQTFEIILP